jgi:predicted permease
MRAYRLLLRLYPASFRHEYGAELRAVFATQRTATTGPGDIALLWVRTVLETVGNAAALHAEMLGQDLRYSWRTLRRMPGFALTAIAVTAIGIGANAAAFSVANFALVQPLPFAHADRLVSVWEHTPEYPMSQPAPITYHDWRAAATSFDAMGAYHDLNVTMSGNGAAQQLSGAAITGQLFQLLGARPIIGHLFSPAEETSGAREALLSYALWRDTYGRDPNVLGRTIVLDGSPRVIAGVMPPDFAYPDRAARVWTPMTADDQSDIDRTNSWWYVVGRLKPGVTMAQASAEMTRVASDIARRFPKEDGKVGATVMKLRDSYLAQSPRQTATILYVLCGAAACVLLIACANLANLLLVRALGRRRELAVRSALGAGGQRLVRQLVTETLVVVLIGIVAGTALAAAMLPLLGHLVPSVLPMAQGPGLGVGTVAVASLILVLTAVGFGVVPAVRSGGGALVALREGSRAGGGQRARLRSALVVAEVTLSVLLLISTGLLLRALWRVQAIDPGFRTERVVTLRSTLPPYRYQTVASRSSFYEAVLARVRAIPGVESAGFTSFLPMAMGGGIWPVSVDGQATERSAQHTASLRYVTPGYLHTLGIRVTQGRDVSDGDTPTSEYGAIVSQSFAREYWPGSVPLGHHFNFGLHDRTVVGVVGDVKVRGLDRQSEPQVYIPYRQVQDSFLIFYIPKDLAIRATIPETALVPAVRRILRDVDPDVPVSDVRSMAEIVAGTTTSRDVQVRILTAFALIAIVLAAVGIHGLLAYAVSQRNREIGVRRALGASASNVVGLVMTQSVQLLLAGLVPGALMAYLAGRGLASLLAGIHPGDPATFGVAIVVCATMTLLGSLPPLVRALRVDPNVVMRGEE